MSDATLAPPVTWNLDTGRCAVQVRYALCGVTVWRARLRPMEAHLTTDGDGVVLTATLALRPLRVSLPGTRGWYLRRASRRDHIRVVVDGADNLATVAVGHTAWTAPAAVRMTPVDDDRAVVVAEGTLIARADAAVPAASTSFEVAAEFVRCD